MPSWPADVPVSPLIGQLQIAPEDNVLRFKPDVGPDYRRKRFSSAVHAYSFPVIMTGTQLASFEAFFGVTLQGGALAFDMTNPKSGATRSFWFTAPYQIDTLQGHDVYRVTLPLATLVTP